MNGREGKAEQHRRDSRERENGRERDRQREKARELKRIKGTFGGKREQWQWQQLVRAEARDGCRATVGKRTSASLSCRNLKNLEGPSSWIRFLEFSSEEPRSRRPPDSLFSISGDFFSENQ